MKNQQIEPSIAKTSSFLIVGLPNRKPLTKSHTRGIQKRPKNGGFQMKGKNMPTKSIMVGSTIKRSNALVLGSSIIW
ncbi:hypothetical protein GCM10009332_06580 [Shewanella gelidii]|uniref:Uncharacterized protein n=1 Tax=Shewanella gelidii TaxID=1642821 RepID=A0A917JJR1_9GAMM|nr:hypothetical protein GCM10009332_06580 [Shewanella gelidii]